MNDKSCKDIRKRIALGEELTAPGGEHLRSCAKCRIEVARVGRLAGVLARDAELSVPAGLDLAVRTVLSQWEGAPRSILRPGLAIALAVVAIIAGVLALVGWRGGPGAGGFDPLKVAVSVWLYLAFASVATLPMVFHLAIRGKECPEGVQE